MKNRIVWLLIIGLLLSLLFYTRMTTASKADFDVYVDNQLSASSGIYQVDPDVHIILLDGYAIDCCMYRLLPLKDLGFTRSNCNKGMYYLNLKHKVLLTLTEVTKIKFKDNGKILRINKSSMAPGYLNIMQTADHVGRTLKITNDEIRFTPDTGMLNPCRISKKTEGKEIILKRKQVK